MKFQTKCSTHYTLWTFGWSFCYYMVKRCGHIYHFEDEVQLIQKKSTLLETLCLWNLCPHRFHNHHICHVGQQKIAWFESHFCVTLDNIPFFWMVTFCRKFTSHLTLRTMKKKKRFWKFPQRHCLSNSYPLNDHKKITTIIYSTLWHSKPLGLFICGTQKEEFEWCTNKWKESHTGFE